MKAVKPRVEFTHDGTYAGTKVELVLEDSSGHEKRYEIPHVLTAELQLDFSSQGAKRPMLMLGLGRVHVKTNIAIGPGRMNVDDILAEIAAEHLREDK